ncbi:MAG TPA: histidine kinase N-terminal 7TM domain-containing protein, partial [Candidatus Saccharimonadales bacterium]
MFAKIFLLVLVGSLNVMVALAVLSRSVRRAVNLWFFGLTMAAAGWTFGIAGFMSSTTTSAAIDWAAFYYIAPLAIVAASVPFARVFPSGGSVKTLKVYLTLAGFFILSAILLLWPDFLFGGVAYHNWGKEVILNRLSYAIYSVYLLTAFLLALIPMYRKTHSEKGIFRTQAAVFYVGYVISSAVGVFFNLILPGFGNYQLIWVGPLATTVYIFLTAYGIIKHQLFDVRVVAARAVGYLLSILALGTAYGIAAFAVIVQIPSWDLSKVPSQALSAALAVAFAMAFQPIKRFFDRMTNGLFYRDAYDSQAFLDTFNHALVSTIDLDEMLKATTLVIQT